MREGSKSVSFRMMFDAIQIARNGVDLEHLPLINMGVHLSQGIVYEEVWQGILGNTPKLMLEKL